MITWARIAAIPPVVYFLQFDTAEAGFWAGWLFIIASVSDYFDGYFARIYHVESLTGKFLDPIADKLLVTAALIMLVPLDRVSPILVVLLLSREILINGLRALAATEHLVINVNWTAKWKTGTQMVAIPCLMFQVPTFGQDNHTIGRFLLWVSFGLSVISAVDYLKLFFHRPPKS